MLTVCPDLVEVLPVVLCHEAECAEEGVEEVVVAGVAVVGVGREAADALRALGAAGIGGSKIPRTWGNKIKLPVQ